MLELLILAALGLWLVLALRACRRQKGCGGDCTRCGGDCTRYGGDCTRYGGDCTRYGGCGRR